MRRSAIGLTLFFAILVTSVDAVGQAQDIKGWYKSKWGMSEDEILVLFKNEGVTTLAQTEVWPDRYVKLIIPEMEIEGSKFKVYFQMSQETHKLVGILLSLQGKTVGYHLVGGDVVFQHLERVLVEEYGHATNKMDGKPLPVSGFRTRERSWAFPSTTIHLSMMEGDFGKSVIGVNLSYKQNQPKDK